MNAEKQDGVLRETCGKAVKKGRGRPVKNWVILQKNRDALVTTVLARCKEAGALLRSNDWSPSLQELKSAINIFGIIIEDLNFIIRDEITQLPLLSE